MGDPLRVSLVRDVPEERRVSMELFADALAHELMLHAEVDFVETVVHARRAPRVDRFLRYPVVAARVEADVHHIIDHGYGDVALLLPKRKTLITCHDLITLVAAGGMAGFEPRRASLARFRWSASFLRRVALVVCVSETTRADAVRLARVPEERTRVVRQGCSAAMRPLPRSEVERVRAELGNGPILLHVGGVQPYKNAGCVLDVVANVRRRGFPITLVRAGRPFGSHERARAESLGLAGALQELGPVSAVRLVELYNACDVFLYPSYYEGFGAPVLEAMSCGAPVVASDCGALVELVGDAGGTAPPNDVGALADQVVALLESPARAEEFRRRGLERAAAYSWERTAAEYEVLYAELADRS